MNNFGTTSAALVVFGTSACSLTTQAGKQSTGNGNDSGWVMWLFAQVPDKLIPTASEVAGWTPSQTIQTLLVSILVAVGIGACYGMRALFKSNDTTIAMLSERFAIQDKRQESMEARHATQNDRTYAVLNEISMNLRAVSDSVGRK